MYIFFFFNHILEMPGEMCLDENLHPRYNCIIISVAVGLGPANKMHHLFCY